MHRRIKVVELGNVFTEIRRDMGLPESFPPEVLEEAESARGDDLDRVDLRSVPFVTIDPPGAMDLDQAMAFEERSGGLRLRYAIADLGSFVTVGSALDQEARRRGRTVYCPDLRVPLHPPILSEGSASLLPGDDRPAIVFEIDIDDDGAPVSHRVERALVRSHQRYDYGELQARFDTGNPPEELAPLKHFGETRIARGVERGAITLRLPEQEAMKTGDRWTLGIRPEREVERWNAEVSLLTGMVAAEMMKEVGTGILRTLPAPDEDAEGRMRGAAKSLGLAWTRNESPAEFLVSLDPDQPRQMAMFVEATRLLRGAGYLGFSGTAPDGEVGHAGVAADYAHVTAPLRRLVDRFTLAACLAAGTGEPVPAWVTESVDEIAETMETTDSRADSVEGRCVNAVEAWVMEKRDDEQFEAVVLATRGDEVEVWIDDPPILTAMDGTEAEPGQVITVTVDGTEVDRGIIRLTRTD